MGRSLTEKLSEAITRFISRIGASSAPSRSRAIEHWDEAAGEALASMTTVCGFRKDVLLVRAEHPVAAQEVRLRQEEVLGRLNRLAGQVLFSRIVVVKRGKEAHNSRQD
jgi:hypothetical protein